MTGALLSRWQHDALLSSVYSSRRHRARRNISGWTRAMDHDEVQLLDIDTRQINDDKITRLMHTTKVQSAANLSLIQCRYHWYRLKTNLQGEHKKVAPLQLLLIFHNTWRFLHEISRNCEAIKYTLFHQVWSKFVGKWQTYAISTKTTPHFSAFRALSSPVVCWWLWKEPVCWWWDEDADLQTDRVIADAWSDHHWQPQPCRQSGTWWRLPLPCWRVLVASLPKWSAKRLSTHQLSYASAGVYGTFPAWCPRCDSPVGSNLESLRATQSSQWTCSHSITSAWCSHTEKGGLSWLK